MKHIRMSDLAKKAEVSLATVSRVVNQSGYVAADVRKRVEKAMEETGYVHPAKKIPMHREKLIGIISLYGAINPFFAKMAHTLQEEAEKKGYYGIQISTSRLDNDTLAMHAERLSKIGVCGIVVCSFNADNLEDNARNALYKCNIPVVFLERTAGCYGFNRVLVDSELGTYSATRHLIQKGHKNLVYVSLYKQSSIEISRINGFTKAIEHSEKPNLWHQMIRCNENTPKAAIEAISVVYEENPDISGIVAWNDVYAAGILHFFEKKGRHVPDEVEIIGHDNVLAPHLYPSLSSIEMPIDEIASAAIEIIYKSQISHEAPSPRTITLEPRLVIRTGS